MPKLKYNEAIRTALAEALGADANVVVMGLGTTDPTGVFGTSAGLAQQFGDQRVLDIPCAENGITGIAVGLALGGKKVVLSHQRVDFALLSLEQILNQAAKWHFMFAGQDSVPLVVRLIVGRGWGQGPQHSQFLPALFAHFPGLKVFAPTFPGDARVMLRRAIDDPNPVIFFEHRWLHFGEEEVDLAAPLDQPDTARVLRPGRDVTLVSYSYGTLECREAATHLARHGIDAEVIDLRSLRPLDTAAVAASVQRTGRLVVHEQAWGTCGISAEIIATLATAGIRFAVPPIRLTLPDYPLPTARSLAAAYYSGAAEIVRAAAAQLGRTDVPPPARATGFEEDKPNPAFKGPF
jgi:pyruvate dehydrogenase E1 component beta subunit